MKNILLGIICIIFLGASLRGNFGNPNKSTINDLSWTSSGPFELSPERGRFALTFSLVEDKSFQFSLPIARFAVPDLGYIDGKYVSLFAPGVSFLIIPGYVFGKYFEASQIGAFAIISFFAVLNVLLIRSIARILGAKNLHSVLAGLIFLFATPAYTYAVSLYQHHVSVFLLLAGIWIYLNYKSAKSTFVIWFLVALSIPVDYPNFFMMLPLAVLALMRFFKTRTLTDSYTIRFNFKNLLAISGVILPFLFLAWINVRSYGDPFRLSGTVRNARYINDQGLPEWNTDPKNKNSDIMQDNEGSNSVALGFFNSRNISNGLYIHFLSPDRGILVYSPIILFSVIGAFFLYKKKSKVLALLLSISLINVFIYSMWGDPWGGWAFGSRYLVPLYACSSILLALGLDVILKKKLLNAFFLIFLVYSISVNTLGAITSSANPPKIEVLGLEALSGREEKYTYERNWDYLTSGSTKSFIYNAYLKNRLNPLDYYLVISFSLSFLLTALIFYDLIYSKYFRLSQGKTSNNKSIEKVMLEDGVDYFPKKSKLDALMHNLTIFLKRRICLWKII